MSYTLMGVDVPVTTDAGVKSVEHPQVGTPDCGSALALQQMLADLGYYTDPITGFFNVGTFVALQLFAADVGLPYTPGYYPSDLQCGAMIAAWQNLQAKKAPYPKSGVPTVMPGFTPDDMVADLRARAADRGCPDCAPCAADVAPAPAAPPAPEAAAPEAAHGFWGLDAFGLPAPIKRPVRGSGLPTIGQGSTGQLVTLWQRVLRVNPDGFFGPRTVIATNAWKRARNLEPNGLVDPATWRAAGINPPAALRGFGGYAGFGAFGTQPMIGPSSICHSCQNTTEAVQLWQGFVNTILQKPISVSGTFDAATKAATIAFQKGAKLKADGIVGPDTWSAADRYLASQAPAPADGGAPASDGSSVAPTADGMAPPGGGAPASGPLDTAKAWWSAQPKTTQYAVMGGGALALIGMIVLVTKQEQAA